MLKVGITVFLLNKISSPKLEQKAMPLLDFSTSTPEQQSVILTTEQPLLVIAGPGAGKTKTLVDRVIHLVADLNVPASNIMVATFTEKAAKELVSRISSLAHKLGITIDISDMYIGTLHSIFLNILEEYRAHTSLSRNYRVLDDFEKQYLIFQNTERFNKIENLGVLVNGHFGWNFAKDIASLVSRPSEENLDLEKLSSCTDCASLPVLAALTKEYRALLAENNALDFSLIQTMMWKLLKDEYVLNDLREKIQYLMIDEYQDTNRIQEQILLKLSKPKNKICVVGDDDQALYRFRGATVENILRFQENFAKGECKKIELNDNFRSQKDIIAFYNKYMKSPWLSVDKDGSTGNWEGENGEQFRYDKTIRHAKNTSEKEENYPGVIRVMGNAKVDVWCKEVFDFITALKEKDILKNYNQIAVLSYSVKNDNTRSLAQYLEEHGIPTFSPRSDMFFERKEIRLAIGFYMFIFPKLIEDVLKPNPDYRKADDVYSYYEDCVKCFGEEIRKDKAKHKSLLIFATQKFKELANLTHNTDYAFADLFYQILQFPLFKELIDVELDSGVQDLRPAYNLAKFSQLLTRFEAMFNVNVFIAEKKNLHWVLKQLFGNYLNFLYDGGLEEYEDFDMVTPNGCISFMTIHQSKGLQFPVTMVTSLGRSPRKSFDTLDEDIAQYYHHRTPWEPLNRTKYFDFWRLYYTAFSRAQNLLVLSDLDTSRGGKVSHQHNCPSKYFDAVYNDVLDWEELFESGNTTPVLEEVKPSDIKHEYSFTSHILLYEACPLQYKFFRELEFMPVRNNSFLFGTLVHQTIEDIHKTVLEGHANEVTNEKIDAWLSENYRQISKAENAYFSESSLKVVRKNIQNYVDFAKGDWQKVKEAEVPVTLQQEDYILEGKIDLVRGQGDTYEILDFKTGKKPDVNDPESKERLAQYRRQLEIYAKIIHERTGKEISRLNLFYTGTTDESPIVSYKYENASVEKTIKDVTDVVHRIEEKDFAIKKKCSAQQCKECDFKYYCGKNI